MTQPDVYRRPCCDTVGSVDHADWCPEGADVPVTQPQGREDGTRCPARESGGRQCEKAANHPSDHWISQETVERISQANRS